MLGFLLMAALLAARFGRKLSERMAGLQDATENIRRENLEFTVQPSGIREIDEVLGSLDRMKDALQTSLEQQWMLERSRSEQISALAHDIKTPLTIIRGNAELLQEIVETEPQREYSGYIRRSAEDIEAFVQEVIDLSRLQSGSSRQQTRVPAAEIVAELELQMKALAAGRDLKTSVRQEKLPEFLYIHKELLLRGIMNLIANAAEHTPPGEALPCSSRVKRRRFSSRLPIPAAASQRLTSGRRLTNSTGAIRAAAPGIITEWGSTLRGLWPSSTEAV